MGLRQPEEIGVRELRQNASKYLALVGKGQEFVVTNHGRPAARIVPVEEQDEDRVEALIRTGLLIGPEDPRDPRDIRSIPPAPGAPSSQEILDELREDRV
jgi:prevent-host-death family protein